GGLQDRARALQVGRQMLTPEKLYSSTYVARAHLEFQAGSQDQGIFFAREILEGLSLARRREQNEHLRMSGDFEYASAYQTIASDLFETGAHTPSRLEFALQVTEGLRTRVLLERLARRESETAETVDTTLPTLMELRSVLRPDEALVSFMVWISRPSTWTPYTRGHSWALVLTKNDFRAVQIARGETLEPAVRAWTRLVDQNAARPGARRLYEDV